MLFLIECPAWLAAAAEGLGFFFFFVEFVLGDGGGEGHRQRFSSLLLRNYGVVRPSVKKRGSRLLFCLLRAATAAAA